MIHLSECALIMGQDQPRIEAYFASGEVTDKTRRAFMGAFQRFKELIEREAP